MDNTPLKDTTPLGMAQRLQETIEHITLLCKQLDPTAEAKATALVAFEGAYAMAELTRRDEGIPATLIRDVAKKDVRDDRFKNELAESKYKCLIVKIEAAKAILNAKQSQNKYLDTL